MSVEKQSEDRGGFFVAAVVYQFFRFIVAALIFKCCWEVEVEYKGNRRANQ